MNLEKPIKEFSVVGVITGTTCTLCGLLVFPDQSSTFLLLGGIAFLGVFILQGIKQDNNF